MGRSSRLAEAEYLTGLGTMEGADWARIGREIGVSADRVRSGLIRYGDLDPVIAQPRPKRLWTLEDLATATALRAKGDRWNVIAAIVGSRD